LRNQRLYEWQLYPPNNFTEERPELEVHPAPPNEDWFAREPLRWHNMLRDQMIQGYPEQFNQYTMPQCTSDAVARQADRFTGIC